MVDLLITNARIVDGTGEPSFLGNIAVNNGKIISADSTVPQAKQVLDADKNIVAPGFINSHSHGDMMVELDYTFFQEVEQGITTQIAGMCGISAAPFSTNFLSSAMEIAGTVVPYDFSSSVDSRTCFAKYMHMLQSRPLGNNMGTLVGHGMIRSCVLGMDNRAPDSVELERMKSILSECMENGAKGLSFGLIYPPGSYAQLAELIELSSVVTKYDGVVSVHLRNEGDGLIDAVQEMIDVVHASGCKLVISHHKAIHSANYGKTIQTLSLIEQANHDGFKVYCDQYPYEASSTGLKSRIPQKYHALVEEEMLRLLTEPEQRNCLKKEILGNMTATQKFGTTMIGASVAHPEYTGRMLMDIAEERHEEPTDVLMDILRDDRLTTNGIYFCMDSNDIERVLKYPRTMIGTDGIYYKGCSGAHPRAFGTFPRVLGKYVREKKTVSLEDAIRKMTSLPASVYNLPNKGLIDKGKDADLVIFDSNTIADCATYKDYDRKNTGIITVLINGEQVLEHGIFNGRCRGKTV